MQTERISGAVFDVRFVRMQPMMDTGALRERQINLKKLRLITRLSTKQAAILSFSLLLPGIAAASDLRLGIIGTDTSHALAFTRLLNDTADPDHVPGARVVAAWKGGSPDIEESAKRVDAYANELSRKWGVRIVTSIGDLCPTVDGLLLESVDGRTHLPQFRQAMSCGEPIFIDKPLSSTLDDAEEIARLARKRGIAWFSASSLRFSPVAEMRSPGIRSAIVWAPGPLEPHQQLDLSWYGIHGVEMLYTLLGAGCAEVSRVASPDSDVITGRWKDGRLGTIHLQRPYGRYGAVVFLQDRSLNAKPDISFGYAPLVIEIVKFMKTKVPPVSNGETLEIFAFMDAAQRSMAQNGALVALRPVVGSKNVSVLPDQH
jgi:hypothetical protein